MTEALDIAKEDTAAATTGDCVLPPSPAERPPLIVEVINEDELYPNTFERRIPECGAPYPDGLADPLSRNLIDTARDCLIWTTSVFWSPAALARIVRIWQFRKFDFLDWLRPVELLLRRMLLIEAITLIISQVLPPGIAATAKSARSVRAAKPVLDADYPDTWRVSFRTVPPAPRAGARRHRRQLPPIDPDHFPGDPVTPLRYRRTMHNAWPLALRLEAAIRVVLDPAGYARRLAFRLRSHRNRNVSLLIIPRRRPFPRPAPRETLLAAGERAAALHHAWWSSA